MAERTPQKDDVTFSVAGKTYTAPAHEILEWQQGFMRQDDYTRKTQELAALKQQLETQATQGSLGHPPYGVAMPNQGAVRPMPGFLQGSGAGRAPGYLPGFAAGPGGGPAQPPPGYGQQPGWTPNGYPPGLPQTLFGAEEAEALGPEAAAKLNALYGVIGQMQEQLQQTNYFMAQQAEAAAEAGRIADMERTIPGFKAQEAQTALDTLGPLEARAYENYDRPTALRLIHAERLAAQQRQAAPAQGQQPMQQQIEQQGQQQAGAQQQQPPGPAPTPFAESGTQQPAAGAVQAGQIPSLSLSSPEADFIAADALIEDALAREGGPPPE